jgi:DNA-binding GntR family transcriptional regulator
MRKNTDVDLGSISPVSKQPLQTHVYRELRRLIMSGHLLPGQELKVRDLAQQFGTSVQPVREAILQLIAEKALEAAPNASARIPVFDASRLIDLRNVRLAVEGLAAELATNNASEGDIEELANIVAQEIAADDAQDVEASVRFNREFHFRLYQLSGSALLPSIVEGLWLQVGPNIRDAAEVFDARGGKGGAYHIEILRALRKKDGNGVRRALEQDISRFFDLLLARYSSVGKSRSGAAGAVKTRRRAAVKVDRTQLAPVKSAKTSTRKNT